MRAQGFLGAYLEDGTTTDETVRRRGLLHRQVTTLPQVVWVVDARRRQVVALDGASPGSACSPSRTREGTTRVMPYRLLGRERNITRMPLGGAPVDVRPLRSPTPTCVARQESDYITRSILPPLPEL